jgi:hypothetical protein
MHIGTVRGGYEGANEHAVKRVAGSLCIFFGDVCASLANCFGIWGKKLLHLDSFEVFGINKMISSKNDIFLNLKVRLEYW